MERTAIDLEVSLNVLQVRNLSRLKSNSRSAYARSEIVAYLHTNVVKQKTKLIAGHFIAHCGILMLPGLPGLVIRFSCHDHRDDW